MPPARLNQVILLSQVEHSTTEPMVVFIYKGVADVNLRVRVFK